MAKLTEAQKRFIVMALASDYTPTEVTDLVMEEFAIDIDRRQVFDYDAEKRPVAKKWAKLFAEAREEYESSASKVPIQKKVFRLRELLALYRRAKATGNLVLAKDLLEQAAKEAGGSYTNRREFTGKDGKDLPVGGAVVILPAKTEIEDGGARHDT